MGALPTAEELPAPLVIREQWVAWRTEERSGKATKVPVNPATGSYGSATDAETWADFATARECADSIADGVGFVFTDEDPIVGVDLDDCRDPEDGALTDWARDIVDRLESYTEVSPSGTGVHVLVEGELPDGRNRHGDVELYDDARFFTVTGDELSAPPSRLESRQAALTAVHSEYVAQDDGGDTSTADADSSGTVGSSSPAVTTEGDVSGPGNDLGDEALLSRARGATNGEKFARLYAGDMAGYPSQSEADMALCSLLAFWTGGDAEQMDRLFRESGLVRPKWDERHFADGATYGERTIERAIAGTDEFYTTSSGSGGERGAGARSDGSDAASVASSASEADVATVPVSVVEELEAELQQLQAENEELQAELDAERARREELEAAQMSSEESGWWSRLLQWA